MKTSGPAKLLGMADRRPRLLPIADDLCKSCGAFIYIVAMLIYRDRGVKVKIRINVPVRVNPVQASPVPIACRAALYAAHRWRRPAERA